MRKPYTSIANLLTQSIPSFKSLATNSTNPIHWIHKAYPTSLWQQIQYFFSLAKTHGFHLSCTSITSFLLLLCLLPVA